MDSQYLLEEPRPVERDAIRALVGEVAGQARAPKASIADLRRKIVYAPLAGTAHSMGGLPPGTPISIPT